MTGTGPRPFGRDRRIRKRSDFLRVQSQGQRASAPHFTFLVALGVAGPSRLGIVVTKKIGNAVARNRVKRVCRECFRLWPDYVPEGIDLVVIAKEGAPELGLSAVRTEWDRARKKVLERCQSIRHGERPEGHVKKA